MPFPNDPEISLSLTPKSLAILRASSPVSEGTLDRAIARVNRFLLCVPAFQILAAPSRIGANR